MLYILRLIHRVHQFIYSIEEFNLCRDCFLSSKCLFTMQEIGLLILKLVENCKSFYFHFLDTCNNLWEDEKEKKTYRGVWLFYRLVWLYIIITMSTFVPYTPQVLCIIKDLLTCWFAAHIEPFEIILSFIDLAIIMTVSIYIKYPILIIGFFFYTLYSINSVSLVSKWDL